MALSLVTQDIANTGGFATSRNVSITAPAVGDLLVAFIGTTNTAGETTGVTGGGVTTWAELKKSAFSNYHVAIWWGVVDGTPGTTVTCTADNSKAWAINVSQFTGASAWAADANTATATATSTSKGSGSATPAGGSGDYLHLCTALHIGGDDPSAGPTDSFTALTQAKIASGGGTGNTNNSAYRIDTGAATAGNPIWTITSQVWEGVHGIIEATVPSGGDSPSPGTGSGILRGLVNLRGLSR